MEQALKNPDRTSGAPAGHGPRGSDGSRACGLRRYGSTGAGAALALAAATFIGMAAPAVAADPPAADQVWHGCTLGTLASDLENLIDSQGGTTGPTAINDRGDAAIEVAFVVVYSLSNKNDGQPVGSGGFTGPIICTAPGFQIAPATQTDRIPVQSDAASVDILDEENAFILRYEVNGGGEDGAVEKRFCHTVLGNTNCFRIR